MCKHLLHSGKLMCASCMPSALHSLPSASCHLPCVVLQGFTFFLSQAPGVFLCPVVLSVAIISCTLVFCHVPNACPLPSALHSLPSVWSCGVVPSLCPGACVCVFLCVASMFCSLLPFASSLAICCPVLPSDDLRRACVCVPLHTNQNGKMCSNVLHCFF